MLTRLKRGFDNLKEKVEKATAPVDEGKLHNQMGYIVRHSHTHTCYCLFYSYNFHNSTFLPSPSVPFPLPLLQALANGNVPKALQCFAADLEISERNGHALGKIRCVVWCAEQ